MIRRFMIYLIRLYQKYLSPLKTTRCPYCPTCSNYGIIAIRHHGPIKGGFLTLWRIIRCNPFSHGGFDPVPGVEDFDW